MKKYLILTVFIWISLLVIPLCVFGFSSFSEKQSDVTYSDEKKLKTGDDTIKVYNTDEKITENLDFREYIIGVVAAEMPAEFHPEALSACAAAAATLARAKIRSGGEKELSGAVISTDSTKHQAYMNKEEMKKRWGDDFDSYYQKICDAVDKAIDYSITYEGELIVAAYHAISPGMTENAENVWSEKLPYLSSVESYGDKLSPKYSSDKIITFDEFREKISEYGGTLPEDKALWLGTGEYTEAGTLIKISIGDKTFSGESLREMFSLRSAAISLSMNKDGIIFSVKGYGHGVGMSQYGADYLARQGFSWQEIIKHYYTGVEIEIL